MQEFEDKLFDLAIHGVPKREIDRARRRFEKSMGKDSDRKVNVPTIREVERMGIGGGEASKTVYKG